MWPSQHHMTAALLSTHLICPFKKAVQLSTISVRLLERLNDVCQGAQPEAVFWRGWLLSGGGGTRSTSCLAKNWQVKINIMAASCYATSYLPGQWHLGGLPLKMAKKISPIITKLSELVDLGLNRVYTKFEREKMSRSWLFSTVHTNFLFVSKNYYLGRPQP